MDWILQVFQMLAVLRFRSSSLPRAYLPMVFELVLTETFVISAIHVINFLTKQPPAGRSLWTWRASCVCSRLAEPFHGLKWTVVLVGVYENYHYRTADCKVGLIQFCDDNATATTQGLCFVVIYARFEARAWFFLQSFQYSLYGNSCMCRHVRFHVPHAWRREPFKGQGLNFGRPWRRWIFASGRRRIRRPSRTPIDRFAEWAFLSHRPGAGLCPRLGGLLCVTVANSDESQHCATYHTFSLQRSCHTFV